MNDKKKTWAGDNSNDININDLNNLEDELNDLSGQTKNIKTARSEMFSNSFKLNEEPVDIDFHDENDNIPTDNLNLGSSTKEQSNDENKTWDGYDDIAYISNVLINENNLLFDMDFEEIDESMLEDLSGQKNKGILFSDYRVDFDGETRQPSKTKNVNKIRIGRDDDGKAY